MSRQQLAEKIIDHVRKTIMESITKCANADQWDEKEGGAAWLENEIDLAIDLLRKIRPSVVFPEWRRCVTVPAFQEMLQTLSKSNLSFIFFVVEMGGSTESAFFELREKSKEEILIWFKEHEFIFPNQVCNECQKQGKMMKCSVCLDTYYCSTLCQKINWKKHKKSCIKE